MTLTQRGTIRYMAPEVLKGERQFRSRPPEARRKYLVKFNAKADAWSYGTVFQHCLDGFLPDDSMIEPSIAKETVEPVEDYIRNYVLPNLLKECPDTRRHLHDLQPMDDWKTEARVQTENDKAAISLEKSCVLPTYVDEDCLPMDESEREELTSNLSKLVLR